MADATDRTVSRTTNYTEPTDLLPDVAGVKSRVSWPAILGGALTALASYLVLTLLLASIGATAVDQNVRVPRSDIWVTSAIITSIVVSLFLGGWVSSQLTVGENRQEAIIYGILTWTVVTGISLYMVSVGVRAGYFGLLGGAVVGQSSSSTPTAEEVGRRLGYSDEQIDKLKQDGPASIQAALNDPNNREALEKFAVKTSWSALVGTLLSMAAAIGGALSGVGTQFRLFPMQVGTVGRRMTTVGSPL